jgi:uncharacterized membrane protein
MRNTIIAILIIIALSFSLSIYFSPQMPELMASHWNAAGEVDGYMPKNWGLFFMPILSVIMLALLVIVPRIDPLKKNIETFNKYFYGFLIAIFIFLFYLHVLTLMWNLGYRFELIRYLTPGFALLFFYCGILIEHAKKNFFIGIRTPWTLSSDKVWDKTHKIGGKLFKLAGILSLLGIFFPQQAILFILIPILAITLYLYIYSYLEHKKLKA